MGKTKVTLDTNILISALGWNGNPNQVFRMVISGEIDFIISDEQFTELAETLDYPKCQKPPRFIINCCGF